MFDRHSTRCDEAGIGFAEMEKLTARLSNAHGEFNGDCVNGEQQRLHRVRAEYSARLTAPDALDLDRADPCLVRGRCIEHRSAIRTVTSCGTPSGGWNVSRRSAITSPMSTVGMFHYAIADWFVEQIAANT